MKERVMSNYDPLLGAKIQQLLRGHGLENPLDFAQIERWDDQLLRQQLEAKFAEFIGLLGLTSGVAESNKIAGRIVQMYVNERFSGLNYNNFPKITLLENEFNYHEPLIAGNIQFQTTCEHHLLNISGCAAIAYRPQDTMIGLSKFNQLVYFFANRPQLQERLTVQLYITLQELLQTPDVAVVIKARHDCMNINGVINDQTWHLTTQFGGCFRENDAFQTRLINSISF